MYKPSWLVSVLGKSSRGHLDFPDPCGERRRGGGRDLCGRARVDSPLVAAVRPHAEGLAVDANHDSLHVFAVRVKTDAVADLEFLKLTPGFEAVQIPDPPDDSPVEVVQLIQRKLLNIHLPPHEIQAQGRQKMQVKFRMPATDIARLPLRIFWPSRKFGRGRHLYGV